MGDGAGSCVDSGAGDAVIGDVARVLLVPKLVLADTDAGGSVACAI